jgi:hypothetical protein
MAGREEKEMRFRLPVSQIALIAAFPLVLYVAICIGERSGIEFSPAQGAGD